MSKRFRVAFSFAGEKRDYVSRVAHILAERFGSDRVLYDRYHEPEFSRGNLAFHLPPLYQDADLVVAVLCNDYGNKEWCGLEWNAVYGLFKQRKFDDVMLTRFDRVEGEGLFGLAGFLDLDERSAEETAAAIVRRLEINEGLPGIALGGAQRGNDWPAETPALDWSVADHTDARQAFADLITRRSPFRLLPIIGVSGTGKSHLTKQFLGNGTRIPELTCGRFDFKGSSGIDAEVSLFADQLQVPLRAGGGVAQQLGQILGTLREAARPTLLIFDTFEAAGDTVRWVKENLLLAIVRVSWLRVVIVGQEVPRSQGEAWSAVTPAAIELRHPSPQEWLAYGSQHTPDLTIEFVAQAHALANGRSSTLAQLLGPRN